MIDNSEIAKDAKKFIYGNRKSLIEKFANIFNYPPESNPFSIFMAGSPGAGKTEASKSLIRSLSQTKIVRIDADEIKSFIPQYNKNNSSVVQGASSLGVDILFDSVLCQKQNVILDGTFANYEISKRNVERSLKRGRKVGIFYIYQDPLIAWDFTKKREMLEGRYVPKSMFIQSFFNSKNNVNEIKNNFRDNIEINLIIKNFTNDLEKYIININNIDNYLKIEYTKESLEEKLC